METARETNDTNTEEFNNIKQLEVIIKDMKKELQNKDEDIMIRMKEISDLKREIQQIDAEMIEKEATIKKLEDEDSFTQESDDDVEDITKKSGNNVALGKANGDTESESEEELDLFQLEVVSDE